MWKLKLQTKPNRGLYGWMVGGAAVGLVAGFLQTLEKLALLKDSGATLYCSINDVFSCTRILNAPQAEVFGFPNSIMSSLLLMFFLSIGLVGLSGGNLPKRLRLSTQFLSLFMLGFGLWFMWQSIYNIGAVCIFCLFIISGLLVINWGWLRLNVKDLPFLSRGSIKRLQQAIKLRYDILGWFMIAVLLTVAIIAKFS